MHKYKIKISKEGLRELYEGKGFSLHKIAGIFSCCPGTIWKRLHQYGIPTRKLSWNATDLTKKKLWKWYICQKLSTWEIEKRYKYSRGTVHRKLREFGIGTRSASMSHIRTPRKDFDGMLIDKAYLLGFARGDLRVKHKGESIYIACGSTKPAQIELIKNLFLRYGNVWIGKPKNKRINIEAAVNDSFSFLLGKDIPEWVYAPQNFFPFLAGFTDAEGSIFINNDGQAGYSLGNYNMDLLSHIRQHLLRRGIICSNLHESKIKDRIEKDGYGHKQNYWILVVSRKVSLLQLFYLLDPYVKHADKKAAIQVARANIAFRNAKYGNLRMNQPVSV